MLTLLTLLTLIASIVVIDLIVLIALPHPALPFTLPTARRQHIIHR